MVERGGLENRCTRECTVGSNPTPSAKINGLADCGQLVPAGIRPICKHIANIQTADGGAKVVDLFRVRRLWRFATNVVKFDGGSQGVINAKGRVPLKSRQDM